MNSSPLIVSVLAFDFSFSSRLIIHRLLVSLQPAKHNNSARYALIWSLAAAGSARQCLAMMIRFIPHGTRRPFCRDIIAVLMVDIWWWIPGYWLYSLDFLSQNNTSRLLHIIEADHFTPGSLPFSTPLQPSASEPGVTATSYWYTPYRFATTRRIACRFLHASLIVIIAWDCSIQMRYCTQYADDIAYNMKMQIPHSRTADTQAHGYSSPVINDDYSMRHRNGYLIRSPNTFQYSSAIATICELRKSDGFNYVYWKHRDCLISWRDHFSCSNTEY
jgi:hypothetical protein